MKGKVIDGLLFAGILALNMACCYYGVVLLFG